MLLRVSLQGSGDKLLTGVMDESEVLVAEELGTGACACLRASGKQVVTIHMIDDTRGGLEGDARLA